MATWGPNILGDASKARLVDGVPQTRISKYRSSTDGQMHYVEIWDEVEEGAMDVETKMRQTLIRVKELFARSQSGAYISKEEIVDVVCLIDDALAGEMGRAAALIREKIKHRPGYYVELDAATGNIIVANVHLGFCVTQAYVRDHPNDSYLDVVMKNVEHLHQVTCDRDLVRLLRPEELRHQGEAPTKFDD